MRRVSSAIDALCNRHRLFRRAALVWACWLITWVTFRVFSDAPPVISTGTAAALATIAGLLSVVVGFYQWSRKQDDEK